MPFATRLRTASKEQVLFPITLYIGLQYTSSLNAAIYLSTTPALVLLINKTIFKERISTRNIIGVVLSSFGVGCLVMQGNLLNVDTLKNLNQGDVWTIASAVSWALYCSFLRIKPKCVGGNAFVAVSAVIGTVALLPIVAFGVATPLSAAIKSSMNSEFLLGLAYLVIFPSWLSYLLWNKGIQSIGATRGEIFSHLIPLSGGVLSIVFLDITLHGFHLVSAALIASGIILCSGKPKQKVPDQNARQVTQGE